MKGRLKRLDNGEYTILQLDVLKELANIGGGNAATSISKLIEKTITMTVPTIRILSYEEVYAQIMAEDSTVNAVLMKMVGDAEGMFLFVTGDEANKNLIKMMLPEQIQTNKELEESSIKELVNIVVTSYLNAIAKFVDVNLISSVPLLIRDMFGAIISSVYIEQEQYDDSIMIIKNEFSHDGDKIEASLYFVPRPGLLEKLFKILGVGEDEELCQKEC